MNIPSLPPPTPPPPPPPSTLGELFDRAVNVLGRFAPFVLVVALVGYGFIEYTKVQAVHLEKINETFKTNFEKISKQTNDNFQAILQQSQGGQALYGQLNDVLKKQIENLNTVSETQKKFLEDSAEYLQRKIKTVNEDIKTKEGLEAAQKSNQDLQAQIGGLRGQIETKEGALQAERGELQNQKNARTELDGKITGLLDQLQKTSHGEGELREKLIALSDAVNENKEQPATEMARANLLQYKKDYVPGLLRKIFAETKPELFLAERLENQTKAEIENALGREDFSHLGIRGTLQANGKPTMIVGGLADAPGLHNLLELQFKFDRVYHVSIWTQLTLLSIPMETAWFDTELVLLARRMQVSQDDTATESTPRHVVAIPNAGKITAEMILNALMDERDDDATNLVLTKGGGIELKPADVMSLVPNAGSRGVINAFRDLGPRGTLISRAVAIAQFGGFEKIAGVKKLPPEAHDIMQKLALAVAQRNKADFLKLSKASESEAVVESLLRMTSLEMVPRNLDNAGGSFEVRLRFRSATRVAAEASEEPSQGAYIFKTASLKFESVAGEGSVLRSFAILAQAPAVTGGMP